jgi:hypothetical protein
VARELTNRETAIFRDLKLLVGYRHAGYRTDAKVNNHWWLRPLHPAAIQPPAIQPLAIPPAAPQQQQIINISDSDDDEQPPEREQPPARPPPPPPPPENLNDAIIILARNKRSPRGNHNISWQEVHRLFTMRYPEVNTTCHQLRNRVMNLQKKNPDSIE